MTEIFEYVFKQAVGTLDKLMDLEPENQQVKFARAALLQARPRPEAPGDGAPRSLRRGVLPDFREAPVASCTCKECAKTGETLPLEFETGAELEPETFLTRTEMEEIKLHSGDNNMIYGPLSGRWLTFDGTRAEVRGLRSDGAWEGFAAGHGEVIWDAAGNNFNPFLALKERIRPASKEAQGGAWVNGPTSD